jgi:hypothetical protein
MSGAKPERLDFHEFGGERPGVRASNDGAGHRADYLERIVRAPLPTDKYVVHEELPNDPENVGKQYRRVHRGQDDRCRRGRELWTSRFIA